jgi:ubiquinone/menaquinone biosynthesis C-methylase UbiE
MPRPYGYVSAEYLRGTTPEVLRLKKRSYDLLKLDRVQSVLDAGCGPGIDTVQMALRIGKGGKVTGVDIDERMLAEADRWAMENKVSRKVEHILGDVYDLPFEDNAFDACRAERLLQNIPVHHRGDLVLKELLRVLRPGGRIVLIDTDYGSASLDFSNTDLERKMMRYASLQWRPDGVAGRKLYGMLKTAGVKQIKVLSYPVVITDLKYLPVGETLANRALEDKVITRKEAKAWMTELRQLDLERRLFFGATMHMVTGVK